MQVVQSPFSGLLARQGGQRGLQAVAQCVVLVAQGVGVACGLVGGCLGNQVAHCVVFEAGGVQGFQTAVGLHGQFLGFEQLVQGVVAVVVVVGGGALIDQAANGIAYEFGALGLGAAGGCACAGAIAPLRDFWGLAGGALPGYGLGLVAHAGVVGDGCGPAVGVVFDCDLGAADPGFLGEAVGCVVLEVKGLAVLVDQRAQAVGGVVMERDGAVFGVAACAELVAGVVGKAGGAAQRVTGSCEPAGGVVLVALAGPICGSDRQQLTDGVVRVLRSVISTFFFYRLAFKSTRQMEESGKSNISLPSLSHTIMLSADNLTSPKKYGYVKILELPECIILLNMRVFFFVYIQMQVEPIYG